MKKTATGSALNLTNNLLQQTKIIQGRKNYLSEPLKIKAVSNQPASEAPVNMRIHDGDEPARLITQYIRKVIADSAYNRMFTKGNFWKDDAKIDPNSGILFMQKLSKDNLRELYRALSPLSNSEKILFEAIQKSPFRVTHASNSNIVNENGLLALYSLNKIQKNKITVPNVKSTNRDINELANDDFVFFSLETGSGITPKKGESRFGDAIYHVDFEDVAIQQVGWVSLNEQLAKTTGRLRKIPGLSDETYNKLSCRHFDRKKTMFLARDFRTGLSLSVIQLLRDATDSDRETLLSYTHERDLNQLINRIYRPEVKIPKHFFSRQSDKYLLCGKGNLISPLYIDNKEKILNLVSCSPYALMHASDRLKNDEDIVRAAISFSAYSLQYAPEKFKDNKELVLKAIVSDPSVFMFASGRLKDDYEIAEKAIVLDAGMLQYASDRLRDHISLVSLSIKSEPWMLAFASQRVQDILKSLYTK